MPTQPNRAARRTKPAKAAPPTPAPAPKPKPLERRVAQLEDDLRHVIYLHAELSNFVKNYIAQDVAAKMGPAVQEQLKARAIQQMSQGLPT